MIGKTDSEAPGRLCSAALFGNRLRLEVCAALSSDDHAVTYARKLAVELHLPDNQVRNELLRLEASGFLERVPRIRSGGQEPQYFRKRSSVLWTFAPLLLKEVSDRQMNAAPQPPS